MRERPILFSGPMVRSILDGTKTQTRRIVPIPEVEFYDGYAPNGDVRWSRRYEPTGTNIIRNRYGAPGDRLWVRETWQAWQQTSIEEDEWETVSVRDAQRSKQPDFECGPTVDAIEYRADKKSLGPWTPSIHMPRWASRIALEVTGVRVERLQDISEGDARSEGCLPPVPKAAFWELWDSINGKRAPWASNPWVWVIEFKRTQ